MKDLNTFFGRRSLPPVDDEGSECCTIDVVLGGCRRVGDFFLVRAVAKKSLHRSTIEMISFEVQNYKLIIARIRFLAHRRSLNRTRQTSLFE